MSLERHADFERIRAEFIKYYGSVQEGDREYKAWLKALNLDDDKSYAMSQKEKFSFIKPMLAKLREDKENVYYRVLVGFPLKSMNDNLYSQGKLSAAAGGLVDGFDLNLNHFKNLQLKGCRYIAAKFEDGAVEAVLKVPKALKCSIDLTRHMYDVGEGKPLYEWIDEHVIVNQSLEADEAGGFHFTGSALLTKDTLPGIPLSRIFPLEHVVSEALSASQMLKGNSRKVQIVGLGKEKSMSQSCPSGQHWDSEKGMCVPDAGAGSPPSGTNVAAGQGASGDNSNKSVEADYPFDQCMSDMQAQGHDKDSAGAICAAIKNGTVSHAMLYGIVNTKVEAIQLVAKRMSEDKLFAYLAGEVERLKTTTSNEALASAKVAVLEAEKKTKDLELQLAAQKQTLTLESDAKVKGFELNAERTKAELLKESKARQEAEGRIIELQARNSKLEKRETENVDEKIADGNTIKKFQRLAQDKTEELENLTVKNEKLVKEHGELEEKYRAQLAANLELSKKLTNANEQYLDSEKKAEKLEEENKKHKRLAKIIVTT